MRKAIPVTSAKNNEPNKIMIDGLGTMYFSQFATIIYKAGLITYETYVRCRKVVISESICTRIVNEKPDLFPINF